MMPSFKFEAQRLRLSRTTRLRRLEVQMLALAFVQAPFDFITVLLSYFAHRVSFWQLLLIRPLVFPLVSRSQEW